MSTAPGYSVMSQFCPVMRLKADLHAALDWLEKSFVWRSRIKDGISSTARLKHQQMVIGHHRLVFRLVDSIITAAEDRPAFINQECQEIRVRFERMWMNSPLQGRTALATNNRDRTVIVYGEDPGPPKTFVDRFWSLKRSRADILRFDLIQRKIEDLRAIAVYEARNSLQYRMTSEAVEHPDWFLVFDTLTVDARHHDEFWGDKKRHEHAWKRYNQAITRDVARALGLKRGQYRQPDIHRYVAVVERGEKTGRLHVHVVHYVKELPNGSADPNYGRRVPSYREIRRWKDYWSYGYSSPQAVRFNSSDAYAQRGWRWPVQRSKRNGNCYVAIRLASPADLGRYLGKYLGKDVNKVERDERWRFRTKMTQGFGRQKLRQFMESLTLAELRKVCMEPLLIPQLRIFGKKPPRTLVAVEATRVYLKKMIMRGLRNGIRILMGIEPRPNILQQYSEMLKMLTVPTQTLSEEVSTGHTLIASMSKTTISDQDLCRGRNLMASVQCKIDVEFPVVNHYMGTKGPYDVR